MKMFLIAVGATVVIAGGALFFVYMNNNNAPVEQIMPTTQTPVKQTPVTTTPKSTSTLTTETGSAWKEVGPAISGTYADADVVDLGNNTYRMYYSVQPEVTGNKFELYSALSSDGMTWKQEDGVRKTFSTFADVIKLSDNTWRMYFQSAGVIKSATSKDGLTWKDESGTRIDTKNDLGVTFDNVAATTTAKMDDGTYVMVYRGTINTPYVGQTVPNKNTQMLLWATSKDGLTFEKKGLAVDSRTSKTLYGLTDGPDFVKWSDNTWRVFFWSYNGVYYVTFDGAKFGEPVFEYTNKPGQSFPPEPPGDPTFIHVGTSWYMYYGQKAGIYYATLPH